MLSYVENEKYFLSMEMSFGGDCCIILREKVDENHGKKVYYHQCREFTKNEDFAIYHDLEKRIKDNTLDDEYVSTLK